MTLAYQSFDDSRSACRFLAARQEARLIGGGTILVRRVNEGDPTIGAYVRLRAPEFQRIEMTGDSVRLGAGVTMAKINKEPALADLWAVAKSIGGPAVRSAATVGGNLFASSPYGDFAVALLALDAIVAVESADGVRELDLATFFEARARLPAGIIISAVRFSPPRAGEFRFLKISRVKPTGAAVLSIAAAIATAGTRISRARVALGAMARSPIRARHVEEALEGAELTREAIERAVPAALADASPCSDAIASEWYRKAVLPVHLCRLLLKFLEVPVSAA